MTTTDQPEPAEPWAAVVGDWDVPGMLPGHVAHLQRIEAAEERRVEAERADRADARQTLALWEARQHALHRGLPWDPRRPFEHMPTVVQRADMMFAHQDLAARQADFRAAQEAGLVHLLHQSPGPDLGTVPGSLSPPPGSGPGASQAEETARSKAVRLRARIARVLTSPAATRHDKHPLSTNGEELYR